MNIREFAKGLFYLRNKTFWLLVNVKDTTLILPCESLTWTPRNRRLGKHLMCSWKRLLSNSGRKQLCGILLTLWQETKVPTAYLQLVRDLFPSNDYLVWLHRTKEDQCNWGNLMRTEVSEKAVFVAFFPKCGLLSLIKWINIYLESLCFMQKFYLN